MEKGELIPIMHNETKFNRKTLPFLQQKKYDVLRKGFAEQKRSIKLQEKDISVISSIIDLIKLDCPEIYYVDNATISTFSSSSFSTVEPQYTRRKDEIEILNKQIEDIGLRVISRITSMDEWHVLLYIHDLICKMVVYEDTCKDAHTVIGALINKRAVCDGISKAFKFFCDRTGITCCIVSGKAKRSYESPVLESHAWNKVMINGMWFNVDVTFDLTIGDGDFIRHDYFLVSDQSIAMSHTEDQIRYPATTTGQDYYTVNNLLMNTQKDLMDFAKDNYTRGNRCFEVKLPSTQNIDLVEEKVLKAILAALEHQKTVLNTEIYSNKDMLVFGVNIS